MHFRRHKNIIPGGRAKTTLELEPDRELAQFPSTIRTLLEDIVHNTENPEVWIAGTISAYDPGRYSGPPEDCYPEEGGDVDVDSLDLEAIQETLNTWSHGVREQLLEMVDRALTTLCIALLFQARERHQAPEAVKALEQAFAEGGDEDDYDDRE